METKKMEDLIDIELYSQSNQKPPAGKRYQVKVDQEKIVFNKEKVTREEILEAACKMPTDCFSLYQKRKGCDFDKVGPTQVIDLTTLGIEHFITKAPEVWYYDFDDEPETTDLKEMTPDQILKSGGVDPKNHYLVQINADGSQHSFKGKGNEPITMKCPRVKYISVMDGPTPVS